MKWFDVDKGGLARLMAGRGPEFIGRELVQNALDETSTAVVVQSQWEHGVTMLRVTDDNPEGFHDLSHAWTLFAESRKKGDATKRGRFNLGEKLVLALCREATITTTKGRVRFDARGRHRTATRTEAGSIVEIVLPQRRSEYDALLAGLRAILPPIGVRLTLNGAAIECPDVVRQFTCTLDTELADGEGILRVVRRPTRVRLYRRPRGVTTSWLHELGIPVVDLDAGDRWHVDIGQKVPLTLDRDNVRPAFLRALRIEIANRTQDLWTEADANAGWAREAVKDPAATRELVARALDLRFGSKRVAWDPSDVEANHRAMAEGYTVVKGGQLSAAEWDNARRFAAIPPAGQVTPSAQIRTSPDGADVQVPRSEWTEAEAWVVGTACYIGGRLLGKGISVGIVNHRGGNYSACYGSGRLEFNLAGLRPHWFEAAHAAGALGEPLLALLLHELAHDVSMNHLSEDYHEAICRLGAKLARLADAWDLRPETAEGSTA